MSSIRTQAIGPVLLITIDHPPINATSHAVRADCARGEAENRIEEAQLDLFGTRASCHRFAANQLRLLLAALACALMQRLHDLALKGSELERAAAATIRVRLLKIGAAVLRNTRLVRVLLASQHRGAASSSARRGPWPRESHPVLSPAR